MASEASLDLGVCGLVGLAGAASTTQCAEVVLQQAEADRLQRLGDGR